MIRREQSVLMLVDIQGKLADLMQDRDLLFSNLEKLTRGAQALQLPIIWVEQNPRRMGETIAPLRALLTGLSPITKMSFSCCAEPAVPEQLKATGRHEVLLAGIETHVCIYQTARDLLADNYEVEIVADAVSSRTAMNRQAGLDRIRSLGGRITTVEMCLFELLKTAADPLFKDLLKIVK